MTKDAPAPPRIRCVLKSLIDVRRELAVVYRQAKAGTRTVADARALAGILSIVAQTFAQSERRRAADENIAAPVAIRFVAFDASLPERTARPTGDTKRQVSP
jgi:hypothetical protein